MAALGIGDTVDIHGGGLDLVFPHHENEIAQSECAHSCHYVRYWMHNGMLTMGGGQKMGKSLGNVINVRDALTEFPPETLRMFYLQNHYRSPLPWSAEALPDALAMLARLYEARENAENMGGEGDADGIAHSLGEAALTTLRLGRALPEKIYSAMDQDFNTSQALGHLYEIARVINRLSGHKKAKKRAGPVVAPALEAFELAGAALGILTMSTEDFQTEVKAKRLRAMGIDREEVESLLTQRTQARADKDWARADAIRAQLDERNIVVMDRAEGVDWRVRLTSAEDASDQ